MYPDGVIASADAKCKIEDGIIRIQIVDVVCTRTVSDRPEKILLQLPRRKIPGVLLHQGQMMQGYQPNWMADTGHFEFRSPHEPPRRIPISETGYRSHFAPMDDVEASTSPQEYMRAIFLALLTYRNALFSEQFPEHHTYI